jgi:hypothetical protein
MLRREKAVLWLAALAIALHGLWPLVVQLRAGAPAMVQVICTVHGTMLMSAEDVPGAPPASQGGKLQPCAMCAAVSVAMVSALAGVRLTQAGALSVSSFVHTPVDRPAIHSPVRPRAPPAIS